MPQTVSRGFKGLGRSVWQVHSEYESDGSRCDEPCSHYPHDWFSFFRTLRLNEPCLVHSLLKDYLTKFCNRRDERWTG